MALLKPQKVGIGAWENSDPQNPSADGVVYAGLKPIGFGWYDTWNPDKLIGDDGSIPFFPGFFYPSNVTTANLNKAKATGNLILGFNEPWHTDPGWIYTSPSDALALWPQFLALGNRLATPSISGPTDGNQWLTDFMAGANASGYRVDVVNVHYYSNDGDINNFKAYLQGIYNQYGKPIVVTEWARVTNWSLASSPNNPQVSPSVQAAWAVAGTEMMDTLDFVEGHAWFAAGTGAGGNLYLGSELLHQDGSRTVVGDAFYSMLAGAAVGSGGGGGGGGGITPPPATSFAQIMNVESIIIDPEIGSVIPKPPFGDNPPTLSAYCNTHGITRRGEAIQAFASQTLGPLGQVATASYPTFLHVSAAQALGSVGQVATTTAAGSGGFSYVSDTGIYPPPTSGAYMYSPPGGFLPGASGFPALGGTYTDPVFGITVRRITSTALNRTGYDGGDIYEKQGWWSADGTYFVHTFADSTVRAIRISDGATFDLTNAGNPYRQNASCHPVNDNEFWYVQGTTMKKQLISTGAISTVHDFGVTLGGLGGSLDIFDNTGQYLVVNLGGSGTPLVTVYDTVNNIVFSGGSSYDFNGGYATITPDGNYIISVGANKYKYAIDKTAHTVATANTTFAASGSDHGNLSWASDGNTYFVNVNNDSSPAVYQRTNIATGAVSTFFTVPSAAYFGGQPDHFSRVKRGAYRDWVFYTTDQTSLRSSRLSLDLTSSSDPWSQWINMQNEIGAINILTGEIRRLAHHRARQPTTTWNYALLPRGCAYWGGSQQHVMWMSNYGYIPSTGSGYGDLYMVTMPT